MPRTEKSVRRYCFAVVFEVGRSVGSCVYLSLFNVDMCISQVKTGVQLTIKTCCRFGSFLSKKIVFWKNTKILKVWSSFHSAVHETHLFQHRDTTRVTRI